MGRLPDHSLVVRGGLHLPSSFKRGSGVAVNEEGKLDDVSVNCDPDATLEQLTAPNAALGYVGIKHNQIGVTPGKPARY